MTRETCHAVCLEEKHTHSICVWTNNITNGVPESQKASAADRAEDKQRLILSCVREAGGIPASASLRLRPCVCVCVPASASLRLPVGLEQSQAAAISVLLTFWLLSPLSVFTSCKQKAPVHLLNELCAIHKVHQHTHTHADTHHSDLLHRFPSWERTLVNRVC